MADGSRGSLVWSLVFSDGRRSQKYSGGSPWIVFSDGGVNVAIENECVIFRRDEIPVRIFREDEKTPVRREEITVHFRREEVQMIFREAICNGS